MLNLAASLSILVLLSAAIAIVAAYVPSARTLHLAFKPITTVLILLLVLTEPFGESSAYSMLIASGLAFSLIGDVMLMLPAKYFIAGIAGFAAAHGLYLAAFVSQAGWALIQPANLLPLLAAALLTRLIWNGIGNSLRPAVLIYVLLITAMLAQAIGAAISGPAVSLTVAAVGAALFFISDGILAIDRFRVRFRAARAAVLSLYWLGQWLIAMSTRSEFFGA